MNKNDEPWIDLANHVSAFAKDMLNGLAVNTENGVQVLTSILFRRLVFGLDAVRILVENSLYTESRIAQRNARGSFLSWRAVETA